MNKRIRQSIDFSSLEELRQIKALAAASGLSLSNYIRKKLKLQVLEQGGARENTGKRYCADCKREGKRVEATATYCGGPICAEHHAAALDAASAM